MAEVRVLGPIEVIGEAGPVVVSAGKHRRLLAALLVRPGVVRSVDLLLDALWDDELPRSAEKLLQVYVSQLRKLLPWPLEIQTAGAGYALDPGDAVLDAVRFEALIAEAADAAAGSNHAMAAALLQQALGLWRGRAYGDLAEAAFARPEAQRLEAARELAVERRIEAELALGREQELLPELLAQAAANPLRERLQYLAMLALYRSGRQAEALEVYQATRATLVDELGVEPGEELRELQRLILTQDPALANRAAALVAPAELPTPPNPLRGRDRELDELDTLLRRDDVRLVVLTGAGGSGKTRLAIEAARRNAGAFASGAAFVSLATVRDPALLAASLAAGLGLQGVATDPLDALAAQLRSRELLLVLDNLEQLRSAAPVLISLLSRAPRLKLLVTSRVVLHVSGEHVYAVDRLSQGAAEELLIERARTADPRFALAGADDPTLRELCQRLDRLPLAIELAAGHLRALTPAELLAHLGSRLPLLVGGPSDLPARQQTLRATLEWSFDQLDDAGRADFVALAVFAGGCTFDAAAAVLGVETLDPHRLRQLVDHSLLVHSVTGHASRYSMLEMVREFAAELLEQSPDAAQVRRRHAEHSLRLAQSLGLAVDDIPAGTAQRHDLAVIEQDNMRVALDWALENDPLLGLRIMGALEQFWVTHQPREAAQRLAALLARADDAALDVRAHALRDLGGATEVCGDWRSAGGYYEQSLRLYRQLGDETGELRLMHRVLLIALVRGDLDAAETIADEGGRRARASGLRYELSEFLNVSGRIQERRGNPELARDQQQESLDLLREIGHWPWGETSRLRDLAELSSLLGRHDEALAYGRDALEVTSRVGNRIKTVMALAALALIARRRGDDAQAGRLWGAIEAEERRSFLGWWSTYRGPYVAEVLSAPSAEFERARGEGAALTLEQAVAEVLELPSFEHFGGS